jgi:hypothetical protein
VTYRKKTPVLCFFEYQIKGPWGLETVADTVMLELEFPDQLQDEFDRVMRMMTLDRRFKVRPAHKPKLVRILAPQHVAKLPEAS